MARRIIGTRPPRAPLDALNRKLQEIRPPHEQEIPDRPRIRRQASIQAVRWANRLEMSDCLDELWPSFEAWLRERPENLDRYLALLRARNVVDELLSRCPKEGSRAADQLLQLIVQASAAHRARLVLTRRLVITISVVTGVVVLIWMVRRYW